MRNNTLKLLILAALVLALGAPLYARDVVPMFSRSGGFSYSNWIWLTPSDRGRVSYTFFDGNRLADVERRASIRCENFKIRVVALVTNAESGGSGHDKTIKMSLFGEGQYESAPGQWTVMGPLRDTALVSLNNPATVGFTDSQGAGYQAQGYLTLPQLICNIFKKTGSLIVTYSYDKDEPTSPSSCCPGKDHHVAFNDPARWTDPNWRSMVIRY